MFAEVLIVLVGCLGFQAPVWSAAALFGDGKALRIFLVLVSVIFGGITGAALSDVLAWLIETQVIVGTVMGLCCGWFCWWVSPPKEISASAPKKNGPQSQKNCGYCGECQQCNYGQ